jgi:hypothetical protein
MAIPRIILTVTQLVNRAPPLNEKNPTTTSWPHQRRAMTRFNVKEIVIARRRRYDSNILVVGFFLFKGGARFANCVILHYKDV